MPGKTKTLVVVESPAKAKTIKKYLGNNYTVKASVGHVMDLPVSKLGVDIKNNFEPTYVTLKGKKTVLSEIGKAAASCDEILLAPDPDREGEAIAKHVADYIRDKSKSKEKNIYRIMVNEITAKGIKDAISKPHKIDLDKYNSQQARRILDRLVGYQISPILWKKVRRGLSAGRVQSVAVRLVVERESEIGSFKPVEYWNIDGKFIIKGTELTARLAKINDKKASVSNSDQSKKILDDLKNSSCLISNVEKKEKRRNPQPPFTTSKLQQDASRKIRFTPKKTMAVAQGLYEGVELGDRGFEGLITYMRTDSVRVSSESLDWARGFIEKEYGKEYLPSKPNIYKTKKAAQDAHEAIRPTNLENSPDKIKNFLTPDQYKLYSMIWNRFIASQMCPSIYDQTGIDIQFNSREDKYVFRATGSILKFAGYEKVYMDFREEEDDQEDKKDNLPDCTTSDKVELANLDSVQKFTQPPARYNYATIIKDLEERGIGRPSTYASIISTIQDRGYVEKDDSNQLRPTELGKVVTELLIQSFPNILDIDFTAGMEDELDRIEEGKANWVKVLKAFYKDFEGSLKLADKNMRDVKREETPTDVKCELCGSTMLIKWGRMGQFLACSEYPECKGTMNFKMKDGDIKVEEKETTEEKCPQCESEMLVKQGRFGKFLACSKYPECKGTKSFSTGIKCPECKQGDLVERRTKRGKPFYSCSKYPDCKFAMWSKPVKKKCTECGSKVMEEKKDSYNCINEDCGHKEKKE